MCQPVLCLYSHLKICSNSCTLTFQTYYTINTLLEVEIAWIIWLGSKLFDIQNVNDSFISFRVLLSEINSSLMPCLYHLGIYYLHYLYHFERSHHPYAHFPLIWFWEHFCFMCIFSSRFLYTLLFFHCQLNNPIFIHTFIQFELVQEIFILIWLGYPLK